MTKTKYICADSIEGIFSAIFDIFLSVSKHETTHEMCELQAGEIGNYELFTEYKHVEMNAENAIKVTNTIIQKMGFEAYEIFIYAASCNDDRKANAIYNCIRKGLKHPRILDNFSDKDVQIIHKLQKMGRNEFFRWREFLQFSELENGVLFSKIGPTCDILMLLSTHFADRFPNENFMIYDEFRDKYLVHEKQKPCVIVYGNGKAPDLKESGAESHYKNLFITFTQSIAIKERINHKLQQQLMPLRIQNYKVEF